MPWTLVLDDREIDLEKDVDLDIWAQVEKETGVQWIYAVGRPLQNAAVACLAAALICERLKIETPRLTAASVFDIFKNLPDEPKDFPTPGTEVPDQAADVSPTTESPSLEAQTGT